MRRKEIIKTILGEHGLMRLPKRKAIIPDNEKTALIFILERKMGAEISYWLWNGSLRMVALQVGVDFSTISKWRKRLKAYAPGRRKRWQT